MVDDLATLVDFLQAAAAVTALTGSDRIYAGQSEPPPGYKPDLGPALCITRRGGRPDYTGSVLVGSYQLKHYGATPQIADQLYRATFDALNYQRGNDLRGEAETLGQNLTEPERGWYFTLAFYQIEFLNP